MPLTHPMFFVASRFTKQLYSRLRIAILLLCSAFFPCEFAFFTRRSKNKDHFHACMISLWICQIIYKQASEWISKLKVSYIRGGQLYFQNIIWWVLCALRCFALVMPIVVDGHTKHSKWSSSLRFSLGTIDKESPNLSVAILTENSLVPLKRMSPPTWPIFRHGKLRRISRDFKPVNKLVFINVVHNAKCLSTELYISTIQSRKVFVWSNDVYTEDTTKNLIVIFSCC